MGSLKRTVGATGRTSSLPAPKVPATKKLATGNSLALMPLN